MKIEIKKEDVKKTNLDELMSYTFFDSQKDALKRQARAYPLYAYLSNLVDNSTILDIGTRDGLSAISFSKNKLNKVVSYDIVDYGQFNIKKENIEFKLMDFREDKLINYDNVSIIFIDVDPHDGVQEREMYNFLKKISWEGMLVLDDISENGLSSSGLNPSEFIWYLEMFKWWQEIKDEKYNLTDVGHFSGTGLVNFGKKYQIEIIDNDI